MSEKPKTNVVEFPRQDGAPEALPNGGVERRTLSPAELVDAKHVLEGWMAGNGAQSLGAETIVLPGGQKGSCEALQATMMGVISREREYHGLGVAQVGVGDQSNPQSQEYHLLFAGEGDTANTTAKSEMVMAETDRILEGLQSPIRLSQ